ncbi:ribosomal protein L6 [Cristinia sonorae]|uniref:Ribosomal protein L6 n=1 Tax=Cristinia sonorae TaxID=1940300 RepID=A0A8K0UWF7_9AGAR|nr:ribosomal protein L6 [Cristinia sonorae]
MLPRLHQLRPALRAFSSSAASHAHVSNIGKKPITIPPAVTITSTTSPAHELSIQGPLGTTTIPLHPFTQLSYPEPQQLAVAVEDPKQKKQRSMWGTTRTLIQNAIVGMTEGFNTTIYLVGVGYRAAIEDDPRGVRPGWSGKRLNMRVGFSHMVFVPIPDYITATMINPTRIGVSCTDKQKLGLFAAKVRKWRPPEPYKGKGIFVGNEQIRIKAVKKK